MRSKIQSTEIDAAATAKGIMMEVFEERTGQVGVVDLITKHHLEAEEEELQLVA